MGLSAYQPNSYGLRRPWFFYNAAALKQLWDIYTVEYYSAVKKKNLPFEVVWMDMENIMLSEISQSKKDKYSHSCGV